MNFAPPAAGFRKEVNAYGDLQRKAANDPDEDLISINRQKMGGSLLSQNKFISKDQQDYYRRKALLQAELLNQDGEEDKSEDDIEEQEHMLRMIQQQRETKARAKASKLGASIQQQTGANVMKVLTSEMAQLFKNKADLMRILVIEGK